MIYGNRYRQLQANRDVRELGVGGNREALAVVHHVELGVLELSDNFLAKVTGGVPKGKLNMNTAEIPSFTTDFDFN